MERMGRYAALCQSACDEAMEAAGCGESVFGWKEKTAVAGLVLLAFVLGVGLATEVLRRRRPSLSSAATQTDPPEMVSRSASAASASSAATQRSSAPSSAPSSEASSSASSAAAHRGPLPLAALTVHTDL